MIGIPCVDLEDSNSIAIEVNVHIGEGISRMSQVLGLNVDGLQWLSVQSDGGEMNLANGCNFRQRNSNSLISALLLWTTTAAALLVAPG